MTSGCQAGDANKHFRKRDTQNLISRHRTLRLCTSSPAAKHISAPRYVNRTAPENICGDGRRPRHRSCHERCCTCLHFPSSLFIARRRRTDVRGHRRRPCVQDLRSPTSAATTGRTQASSAFTLRASHCARVARHYSVEAQGHDGTEAEEELAVMRMDEGE